MKRLFQLLLVLTIGVAPWATAEQLADLPYSESPDSRLTLDVYRPETPGRYPVVLFVPGRNWQQIDKRAISNRALSLTSTGHLVVAVSYRPQPEIDWREQAAEVALAFAYVRAKAHLWGGNPDQLVLMAEGSGAQVLASLLARPADYALDRSDLRAVRGLALSQPQGLNQDPLLWHPNTQVPSAMRASENWQERSPLQQLPAAAWPVLLSYTKPESEAGQAVARTLKNLGMAVTELKTDEAAQAADQEREWTQAWVKSLAVGRVQRFETLSQSTVFESGQSTFAGWRSDQVSTLLGDRGILFAGLDGGSQDRSSTRIVQLQSPTSPWQEQFRFPDSIRAITWLGRISLREKSALAAIVRDELAGSMLWVQKSDRNWISVATPWPLAQGEIRSVLSQGSDNWVLVSGRTGGVWRLSGESALDLKFSDAAEALFNGVGAGLVSTDGKLYGAWQSGNSGTQIYIRQGTGEQASWLAVSATDTEEGSIASSISAITDDQAGSSFLVAHAVSGRITRVKPGMGHLPVLEFELEAALRRQFADQGQMVTFAPSGFHSALHPESNERVTIIGFNRLVAANATGTGNLYSHLLIRQQGGNYSLRSFARESGASWARGDVQAMAASPFVADQGRRWFIGGAGTVRAGGQAWLDQGVLAQTQIKRGPWWNRAQSGHGFDLQKIGEQWAVLFYSFGADGQPQWWSALGRLQNGQFVSNQNGLAFTEQVLRNGTWESVINTQRSGSLRIRFGLNEGEGACADGVVRSDALALAEAIITIPGLPDRNWCLEPMQLRGAGNGALDNNGLWTDVRDTGWGMSLFAQGVGAATTQGAIAYYYDGAGQPRWALGSGVQIDGRATLNMLNVQNACPSCAQVQQQYRPIGQLDVISSGACGDVALRVSLDLRYPGLAGSAFARSNIDLQRINESSCY